jgi:hypothetical protein
MPGVPGGTVRGPARAADALPERLALAFLPLHKRAFGIAVGCAAGIALALATVVVLVRDAEEVARLSLLSQYLFGYRVSWVGAFIGFAWAFFVGFVAGWFIAFCRNLVVAASVFLLRTRAELTQTRDFLDHI